jgi:hypothetical protein
VRTAAWELGPVAELLATISSHASYYDLEEGSIALGEEFTIITKELDEAQLILSKTENEGEDGKKKDDGEGLGGRKESTFRDARKKAKNSVGQTACFNQDIGRNRC